MFLLYLDKKNPIFELRRISDDLIKVYKILHCKNDPLTTENLLIPFIGNITTRAHHFKLLKLRPNTKQYTGEFPYNKIAFNK